MATTLTEGKRLDDLLIAETMVQQGYCRAMIPLGESVSCVIGTPLDQNGGTGGASLITNGNEANTDAIALEAGASTGVGNNPLVMALVRGPAVINGTQLALQASVTIAEIRTVLAGWNAPVKVLEEPATVTTQTS